MQLSTPKAISQPKKKWYIGWGPNVYHGYWDGESGSPNLYRFGDGGSPKSGFPISTAHIEHFHVMLLPSRLWRETENSRHVCVQWDRSFYGDLHEMSDILMILLICVESDKIPLLRKLKQLYKCLPVSFLIDIAYTANNILYKLYTKMEVYF